MFGSSMEIRCATTHDTDAVVDLASQLATSFPFSRARFQDTYAALLPALDARLLVAADAENVVGYLLGFHHGTFYANGLVARVEEIFVLDRVRGRGVGRALMETFEDWAVDQGCALVALATRRAALFYAAMGYKESASYLRKLLPARAVQ
jgi:GNAT superfamily N-acetyltransferase